MNYKKFFEYSLFFLLGCLFIYIHNTYIFWDNVAYMLNGGYWLGKTHYFEPLRPPIIPFFVFLFGFFSLKLGFTLFIVSVMIFGYFVIKKLSLDLRVDTATLFFLIFSFPVIFFAFLAGPELISLFLLFMVLYCVVNDYLRGFWLGLAFLLRYNLFLYFPFVFFHKNVKKVVLDFFILIFTLSPWLLYNKIKYGNWFYSVLDSYFLNVVLRVKEGLTTTFDWKIFALIFGPIFLYLLIEGIFVVIKGVKVNFSDKDKRYLLFSFIFSLLSIFIYFSVPMSNVRLLIPGLIFFIILGAIVGREIDSNLLKIIFMIFFIVSLVIWINHVDNSYYKYGSLAKALDAKLGSKECMYASNYWPVLNYFGYVARPLEDKDATFEKIKEGEIFVIFPRMHEPKFIMDLNIKYPFSVYGEGCIAYHDVNQGVLEHRGVNEPCDILSNKFIKWFCYFTNGG